MVRGVARLSAAESLGLPKPDAGRKRRCWPGSDRSGLVVGSSAGDCTFARRSEPWGGEQDERAWSGSWKLAVASPTGNDVGFSVRMAARNHHKLKARANPWRASRLAKRSLSP